MKLLTHKRFYIFSEHNLIKNYAKNVYGGKTQFRIFIIVTENIAQISLRNTNMIMKSRGTGKDNSVWLSHYSQMKTRLERISPGQETETYNIYENHRRHREYLI